MILSSVFGGVHGQHHNHVNNMNHNNGNGDKIAKHRPFHNNAGPRTVIIHVESRVTAERELAYKKDRHIQFEHHEYCRDSIALTWHYCQLHSYDYRFYNNIDSSACAVPPTRHRATPWLKVNILKEIILEAIKEQKATFFIVMDSDAFPRQADVSMQKYLHQNGLGDLFFERNPYSIVVSKEGPVQGQNIKAFQRLNTGVIYGCIYPENKERTSNLLVAVDSWIDGGDDLCENSAGGWPFEQGCLEKLLFDTMNETLYRPVREAVFVPDLSMNVLNGPWGRQIRHIWGGIPGEEKRKYEARDLVQTYDIDVDEVLDNVLSSYNGTFKTCDIEFKNF